MYRTMTIIALLLWAGAATAAGFAIEPFVTNVTPNSIDICFTSDQAGTATIHYGPDDSVVSGKTVEGRPFETLSGDYFLYAFSAYHQVTHYTFCTHLGGLQPDSVYFYAVELGDEQTEPLPFVTAPDEPAPFSFIIYGDSRSDQIYPLGVPNRFHEQVIERMAEVPADLILHTGDIVNDGFDIRLWEIALNIMRPISGMVPTYIAFGNHEDRRHKEVDGRDIWPYLMSHPRASSGNEFYYSFDYSNAHFCVVSTEHGFAPGDEQEQWIRADLAAANANPAIDWTFMFYHIPGLTSSFRWPNDDKEHKVRDLLVPLAEELGIDAVFTGHEHSYERSLRESGMYYFVTGNGGALPTFVGNKHFNPWSQFFEPNAAFNKFGFIRVQIAGNYLALESIICDGTIIDTLEIGTPPLPTDDDTVDDDTSIDDDIVDDDDDDSAPDLAEGGETDEADHHDESETFGCLG